MSRKTSGEPKTFAYEEFMARARKEGRVRNETLSMKVLKPDLSLQARVNHIDVDHVRALHDILKNGQQLAPIVVFEVAPGVFKIADGFHRHEVYKREKSPGIPCVVVTGTLQEAIEYAASANQALSLPRTREDTKKAVLMLLENGWLDRASDWIARVVGVSSSTVNKYRNEFLAAKRLPRPDTVLKEDGTRLARRTEGDGPKIRFTDKGYRTKIGGRTIYLGGKYASAREINEKLDRTLNAHASTFPPASSLQSLNDLAASVAARGVVAENVGLSKFIGGFAVRSVAVVPNIGTSVESTLAAAMKALAVARHIDSQRAVVVRSACSSSQSAVEAICRQLGVVFMTLDEFVAAVKADDAAEKAVAR